MLVSIHLVTEGRPMAQVFTAQRQDERPVPEGALTLCK